MIRLFPRAIFSTSLTVVLGSCSLRTFPPPVNVQIRLSGQNRSPSHLRVGPELDAMTCYGVIVRGAPGAVSDSQVNDRSVSCLGMNGAFNGPYTYSQLLSGVSLSLSAASYTFSIVGFSGVASCGSGPSSLYNTSTAAENYAVGQPVTVNLATDSSISMDGRLYSAASATNRTPSCPTQTMTCGNSPLCDTFTDPDGTSVTAHVPEAGSPWVQDGLFNFVISNNSTAVAPTSSLGAVGSLVNVTSEFNMSVTLRGTFGRSSAESSIGVLMHYTDPDNYVFGEYHRTDGTQACSLTIFQVVNTIYTSLGQTFLNYPDECPWEEMVTLNFTFNGTTYILTKGARLASGVRPPTSPSGNKVGIGAKRFGTELATPRADFFQLLPLP